MSRLENTVKIGVFGFAMSWHVFGPFFGCLNFDVFFFLGLGRPLKTLKKPKKIITFWLASNFLSNFLVVVLSSLRRCRIGPKQAKKRPEMAALKKHREN